MQALEERIEYLNTQTLMTEAKPCDETLHVKDQYIYKLEKEKADIETESNKAVICLKYPTHIVPNKKHPQNVSLL